MLTMILPGEHGLELEDHCDGCGAAVCDDKLCDGRPLFDDDAGDEEGLAVVAYADGSILLAIADVGRRFCVACRRKLGGELASA